MLRRTSPRLVCSLAAVAAFVAGVAGAAGCLGDNARLAERPDAGQTRSARARVEITLSREAGPAVTSDVRFLRVRDMDNESAHVLAGAGAGEFPVDLMAPGRCMRLSGEQLVDDALSAASPDAQVTMLDGGDLVVLVGGSADRLSARYLPDIVPFVTGVVYESERGNGAGLGDALDLGEAADVQIAAFGGPDVGRFDVGVAAPPGPVITRVAGQEPGAGAILVDRDGDLEITWAEAPGREAGDAVVVSVAWTRDGDEALRCRALERVAGRFVVPAVALGEALRGLAEGAEIRLGVERIRRVSWAARGLDEAELVVVVRDVVGARLR